MSPRPVVYLAPGEEMPMPTEELKIGDTVQLNSGGPLMTVTNVNVSHMETPRVSTTWFEEARCLNAIFPQAALRKRQPVELRATEVPGAARTTPGNSQDDCG